jgi:hypothetical protein
MTIDWSNFTPWSSLAGGIVLGVASALFVLMNGRILGISGIIGGLVKRRPGDSGWRIAFVLGLLAAPAAWSLFAPPAAARIDAGWHALWRRLYQRSRRVRAVAPFTAFARSNHRLHGRRLRHGLRRPSSACSLSRVFTKESPHGTSL